jgi:hypothetical protein
MEMAQRSDQELKDLTKRAADIVKDVPAALRPTAFVRIMDELLGKQRPAEVRETRRTTRTGGRTSSRARARTPDTSETDAADELMGTLDRTKHSEIREAEAVRERALWILRIAQDDHGIDGLGANQIARVLSEKFRIKTSGQAVRQALERSGDLVDRDARGPVVQYRIMARGETYLDSPGEDSDEPTPRPRRRTSSRARRRR